MGGGTWTRPYYSSVAPLRTVVLIDVSREGFDGHVPQRESGGVVACAQSLSVVTPSGCCCIGQDSISVVDHPRAFAQVSTFQCLCIVSWGGWCCPAERGTKAHAD